MISDKEMDKLIDNLKHDKFCSKGCYGCCGDERICWCEDVKNNLKKYLENMGR